jgi:hypothetical protein
MTAGLVTGAFLFTAPQGAADKPGQGSVRHSSAAQQRKRAAAPAQPRTAGRPTTRERAAARQGARAGARAGARVGYRHGRYTAWNNAWRDYRRWRAITGLFKLGVYMATKPSRTTTAVVTGTTYYYSGGVYFVPSGSGYVVVSPPPGAVVYAVPAATTVVYVGQTPYYYYAGTYYVTTTAPAQQPPPPDADTQTAAGTQDGQSLADVPMTEGEEENFEVVAPPVGASVPYVPDEADEEMVNGTKYFVYDGTYYRPFASDGETIYMVVEDPRAA